MSVPLALPVHVERYVTDAFALAEPVAPGVSRHGSFRLKLQGRLYSLHGDVEDGAPKRYETKTVIRRSKKALLFMIAAAAAIAVTYIALRFDDPVATIVLPSILDDKISQEVALEISARALQQAGFEPTDPEPAYGEIGEAECFVGRNAIRPDDRVSVVWRVHGDTRSYTVTLDRGRAEIVATISENWL